MFCKNCGKELSIDEKFCSGCGQKQVEEATKEEVAKPKTTKKPTPPPASKKPVVATEKTEETKEKEVVTEKVVQVENKEPEPVVIEVAPQVKPEATEEKSVLLNQSGVAEEIQAKPKEKKGFAAKVVSKLLRFLKSILPGKKEGITPKEQKRNRIIAAILVILLVFSGIGGTGENSMVISVSEGSEYYGGVAFNLTLEEFVEQYNAKLYEVYDQYTAELNELRMSKFRVVNDAQDETNQKTYCCEFYGYKGGVFGTLFIGVDKTNGYIQIIQWGVSESAINRTEQSKNNYLFTLPSRFFALVDSNLDFGDESGYKEVFDKISEGEVLWQGDSVYHMSPLGEGVYLFSIFATTSDSEWTKN